MKRKIKYPQVTIKLSYPHIYVFDPMEEAARAMRSAGISEKGIEKYIKEAERGDFNHLMRTIMRYVNVE